MPGYRWVIDPLDGTVNFIHGIPQASCFHRLSKKAGVVLAGGVFDPFRAELFMAARGRGATLNGRSNRRLRSEIGAAARAADHRISL